MCVGGRQRGKEEERNKKRRARERDGMEEERSERDRSQKRKMGGTKGKWMRSKEQEKDNLAAGTSASDAKTGDYSASDEDHGVRARAERSLARATPQTATTLRRGPAVNPSGTSQASSAIVVKNSQIIEVSVVRNNV